MSFLEKIRNKTKEVHDTANQKLNQWSQNAQQKRLTWEEEQIAQYEGVEQSMRESMPVSRLTVIIVEIVSVPILILAVIFLFSDTLGFLGHIATSTCWPLGFILHCLWAFP